MMKKYQGGELLCVNRGWFRRGFDRRRHLLTKEENAKGGRTTWSRFMKQWYAAQVLDGGFRWIANQENTSCAAHSAGDDQSIPGKGASIMTRQPSQAHPFPLIQQDLADFVWLAQDLQKRCQARPNS